MIKIEIFYNDYEQIVGFEVKGHGMSSDRAGQYDLVCCGVSVLTITTVNGITDVVQANPSELHVADGWLRFILPVDEEGHPGMGDTYKAGQIAALLGSMVLGLSEIARDYPKYVQLKKRRWTSC